MQVISIKDGQTDGQLFNFTYIIDAATAHVAVDL